MIPAPVFGVARRRRGFGDRAYRHEFPGEPVRCTSTGVPWIQSSLTESALPLLDLALGRGENGSTAVVNTPGLRHLQRSRRFIPSGLALLVSPRP